MGEALTFVNFGVTGHLRIDRNLGLFIHLGGVDRGSEKYLLEEIWMQCTILACVRTLRHHVMALTRFSLSCPTKLLIKASGTPSRCAIGRSWWGHSSLALAIHQLSGTQSMWSRSTHGGLYATSLGTGTRQRKVGHNLHVATTDSAGHNKWSKIKKKKAVTDMEKSRMRGKLLDHIRAAVVGGGADPTTNIKLSGLLTQAKSMGVPKANIDSALKAASGYVGSMREAVLYEGRGPSGYLILIEALTDNRNRTRPEIRHILEKQGYV